MKILILGAGKMGSFFTDLLSFDHEVGVYDPDAKRMRFIYNAQRFTDPATEIPAFAPEMVINAATVRYTIPAFEGVLPYLPKNCILSDIASVKTGLPDFYANARHPFVSTHPMFGPTFASLSNLADENAIVIKEGDHLGRVFFLDLYRRLHLHIEEYTFEEHDLTAAYCLTIPFASTLAFGSIMKHQNAPGTTFKRHMAIARGLMSEDDFLISEILFNPHSDRQLGLIVEHLEELRDIIRRRDSAAMKAFVDRVRGNIK